MTRLFDRGVTIGIRGPDDVAQIPPRGTRNDLALTLEHQLCTNLETLWES